jgi:hypothetical protein
MKITYPFKPGNRAAWRGRPNQNQTTATRVWLTLVERPDAPTIAYSDVVEEANWFGWINSIQKRISEVIRTRRFSPRKKRGNWTEPNKEHARRLRYFYSPTARNQMFASWNDGGRLGN